jgi:protoporphyrinogen oxidase
MKKIAVIAGAGPAGLTAAFELLQRQDVMPIVFEADDQVGGSSKTVNYRGNRMDLGGHRFFSKSDWVMRWWQTMMPVSSEDAARYPDVNLSYQGQQCSFRAQGSANDATTGETGNLLIRSRLSRIYYRRRFFDYPLKLNADTLGKLGPLYTAQVGLSYMRAQLMRRSPEVTLEDFLLNRFGDKLYRTFFKDYTEKVWGVPCQQISAEWGAQRIKGLSITKAVWHALSKPFSNGDAVGQRGTETSLIERFLYPRLGPGQMWEVVADRVRAHGGNIYLRHKVVGIEREGMRIVGVHVEDRLTGSRRLQPCDYFLSTLPVSHLVEYLQPEDQEVARIAAVLPYRDFMTAGLLVKRMKCSGSKAATNGLPPDNWIYIQEPDVKLGRLQIFNNWSPSLVANPETIWLGLEYFCAEGDDLWRMEDEAFLKFAAGELSQIGMIQADDVLDGTVIRVPKAYPAYFGEYRSMPRVRSYLDGFKNLLPIGRNGMHRYNNQDHSMLSAKAAVDCIHNGSTDRAALWSINSEEDYHESK